MLSPLQKQIHSRAVELAGNYLRLEPQLIAILQKVEASKLYKRLNHSSLFKYAVHELGLSEAVSYAFISVARKCSALPELKHAIEQRDLSVSKASRIASALNADNSKKLIEFAARHSTQQIDREVARLNPKAGKRDKLKPLSADLMRFETNIKKATSDKLKRAGAIEASKGRKGWDEVLDAVLKVYLKHEDPVQKAERALERKSKKNERGNDEGVSERHTMKAALPSRVDAKPLQGSAELCLNKGSTKNLRTPPNPLTNPGELCLNRVKPSKRVSLTAEQKHQVFARDQGRCTHIDTKGNRCENERWLHIHHVKPVSLGGSNDPDNLTTLCSSHHDLAHQLSLPIEGQVNWLRSPRSIYQVGKVNRNRGC